MKVFFKAFHEIFYLKCLVIRTVVSEEKSQSYHDDFLLRFLPLHQHGPKVHAALHGDVEVELVLDLAVPVVEDALVEALILLFEGLDAQNGGVRIGVGPGLESAAFHRQVLEAFEPFDLRRRVAEHLQVDEDVVLFIAAEFVLRFSHELGRSFSVRLQWSRCSIPVLRK